MELTRDYYLNPRHNVYGMAMAVADYFKFDQHGEVKVFNRGNDYYLVVAKSKHDTKNFAEKTKNAVTQFLGWSYCVQIEFYKSGNTVTVDFTDEQDKILQTLKAVALTNFIFGIPKLMGVLNRHEMPENVHFAIKKYLEG